jgi:hypothetical protein
MERDHIDNRHDTITQTPTLISSTIVDVLGKLVILFLIDRNFDG